MLHVPVNTILTSSSVNRGETYLPVATKEDWELVISLEEDFCTRRQSPRAELSRFQDLNRIYGVLEEKASAFSFVPFLSERMLKEAEMYFRYSADALMLENIAAPYFVRNRQPVAIIAIMSLLARELRQAYGASRFGIQVLAFSDDLALIIALRHGFQFIRSETALFAGLRPEGKTPNQGNLANLYAMRNCWHAMSPDADPRGLPLVYVDLRKKHTIFPPGLDQLAFWTENLVFQKVEGAILTGSATGIPVDGDELHNLRQAIDSYSSHSSPFSWEAKLLIGSGVTIENLAFCRHFADAIIVGSALKRNGYWENDLDEERLGKFMEAWSKMSKE